jgi:DNA-binding LacI/PurR family transcriptional regulator
VGKVTLQTIADRVGVSRTTVSNAFSRPDQLSEDLRDRIRAVADELGYGGPDPLARSLRSGRAGVIGILVTHTLGQALREPYPGAFLGGVADVIGDADTGLLLLPLPPGDTECRAVRNAAVDGFIASSLPDGHPALEVVRGRGLPLVTVDSPQLDGVPFVAADDRLAGLQLGQRVFGLGHRDVLVLTFALASTDQAEITDADVEQGTYRVARERARGLLAAAAAAGVPRDQLVLRDASLTQPETARDIVKSALTSPRPPTAIVCLADQVALEALDTARELGLSVPQDVSITGYDDIPAARVAQLTTVRQPTADKGRHALRLLREADRDTEDVTVPHELVERQTLGPAPSTKIGGSKGR